MKTIHKKEQSARCMLMGSMFIFGTIGLFRKYLPLPSSMIALARGIIGMLFLLVAIQLKHSKISWRAIKNNLLYLVLSGIMLGFNWILLFEAYRYTSVAVATLCYYMAPIFVLIISPFVLKEKLTLKQIVCVVIAVIGMVLVSGVLKVETINVLEMKGILLGLAAAILYAGIILANKKIKDISAYDKTVVQLGITSIILAPYILVTENLLELTFTPVIIVLLIIVGILHTGIAYMLYFGSMKDLKAQTIALFSYIDPIVAILLSALLLKEHMSYIEWIGSILVLGSTLISEWSMKRNTLDKLSL